MTKLQNADITNDYVSNESVGVSFAFSQDMPLNKQSIGWEFETTWRNVGSL